jgi:alpha-tubulin suppressor-like RCC1 family protein
LLSSTVTENTASAFLGGGGILTQGNFSFSNSIIAGNFSASGSLHEFRVNGGSNHFELGYNLVGDTAGDSSSNERNYHLSVNRYFRHAADARRISRNYGGTVPTRRLQTGSPAIDKGSAIAGIFSDGRGVIRPFDNIAIPNAFTSFAEVVKLDDSSPFGVVGGNGSDIGAFELIPTFARGWGINSNGNVGDGTGLTTARPTPVDLAGGFTDIISFEGGLTHTLGLRSNGTVVSWGANGTNQLGRPATTQLQQGTPTLIAGLTGVVAIGGGRTHSFAILAGGTVEAWGVDNSGQLGDGTAGGTRESRDTVKTDAGGTTPLTNVIAVSGGFNHSIALRSDGTVWTWGGDGNGQLGDGAGDSSRAYAQQVPGLANVIAIDAGESHCLVLLSDGTLRAWGLNSDGQIGDATVIPRSSPVQPNITGVTQIAAGYFHNAALKADGSVFTWGDDTTGQLGSGASGADVLAPTQINTITQVTDIKSTMGFDTYARRRDGAIFAWGVNFSGEVGNGTTNTTGCNCQPTPTQSSVGAGIAVFGAASQNGFASMPLATVSTGANQFVRLGDATVNFPSVATAGTMQIRTFDPSVSGLTVPAGYTIEANSTGYDITSTAQFTGNAQVCLKTPNVIDQTAFNRLTILHDDNFDGTFDVVTVTKNYQRREVCRVTTSFSPFVLAQAIAPTAANVSISGRVLVGDGAGLRNAVVLLTDSSGNSRQAITSSFGYYRFDNVTVGETYFISVRSKRYFFETQTLFVTDDVEDLNFTNSPSLGKIRGK